MNPFPMGTGVKVWLSTGHTDMRCYAVRNIMRSPEQQGKVRPGSGIFLLSIILAAVLLL
jgi:hypothetical protein